MRGNLAGTSKMRLQRRATLSADKESPEQQCASKAQSGHAVTVMRSASSGPMHSRLTRSHSDYAVTAEAGLNAAANEGEDTP